MRNIVIKLLVVIGWLLVVSVYAEELSITLGSELGTSSSTTDHRQTNVSPSEKVSEHEQKSPNYVTFATEPTVEKTCIPLLNWEFKVADVIALIVVLVGIITIFIAFVPIFLLLLDSKTKSEVRDIRNDAENRYKDLLNLTKESLAIREEISKLKESLKREQSAELETIVTGYSRQVERVIDRQAGRHEERLWRTQIVLNELWDKRAAEVGKIAKEERLDTFLEEFRKQLKDELTFRELLLTDKIAVFTAIGTLRGRTDLPKESTADLLRLLYKQGRIPPYLTDIVREILEQWGEKLTDDEK